MYRWKGIEPLIWGAFWFSVFFLGFSWDIHGQETIETTNTIRIPLSTYDTLRGNLRSLLIDIETLKSLSEEQGRRISDLSSINGDLRESLETSRRETLQARNSLEALRESCENRCDYLNQALLSQTRATKSARTERDAAQRRARINGWGWKMGIPLGILGGLLLGSMI